MNLRELILRAMANPTTDVSDPATPQLPPQLPPQMQQESPVSEGQNANIGDDSRARALAQIAALRG